MVPLFSCIHPYYSPTEPIDDICIQPYQEQNLTITPSDRIHTKAWAVELQITPLLISKQISPQYL